jgi:hypothetical protein
MSHAIRLVVEAAAEVMEDAAAGGGGCFDDG